MKDSSDTVGAKDTRRLAELMALDPDQPEVWQPQELAAMLGHRLKAPVQFDLGGLPPGLAGQLRTLSEAEGLVVKSLSELFQHPHPPLELLRLTKDYARANMEDRAGPLPRSIAAVLYYLTIAVALLRCRKRITELGNAELLRGFQWVADQPWVDQTAKGLIEQARASLSSNKLH